MSGTSKRLSPALQLEEMLRGKTPKRNKNFHLQEIESLQECLRARDEQIKRMKSVGDELLEWIDDNSVSGSNRKLLANAWQRAKEAKP